MTTNIDIKALAKEIAKQHSAAKIGKACEALIGQDSCKAEDCYQIEVCANDGFLGKSAWTSDIRVTPSVKCGLYGGRESESESIVSGIDGIECVAAYWVCYCDSDGSEHELTDTELTELEEEITAAVYAA